MQGLFELEPSVEHLEEHTDAMLYALLWGDGGDGGKKRGGTQKWSAQNVKLKKPWLQFEEGQVFKQVTLNENGVLYLNMEGPERHLFDLPGTNFMGTWFMRLDVNGKCYSLFGGNALDLGYLSEGSVIRSTPTGFTVTDMVANEKSLIFEPNTPIPLLSVDLISGLLTGIHRGAPFSYVFTVELRLRDQGGHKKRRTAVKKVIVK